MEHITKRQYEYLKALLEAQDYVSSYDLSRKVQCSVRTVKTDIHMLVSVLENYNASLEAKTGKGYKIVFRNRKDQIRLEKELNMEYEKRYWHVPDMPEYRIPYIMKKLLYGREKMTISSLSEELYISMETIRGEMRIIRPIMESFGLRLCTEPYKGYYLKGSELARRNCICQLLGHAVVVEDLKAVYTEALEIFYQLRSMVCTETRKNGLVMSDNAIDYVTDYLCLLFLRCCRIPQEEEMICCGNAEKNTARKLLEALKKWSEKIYCDKEIQALSLVLYCKRERGLEDFTEKNKEIADRMLRNVEKTFSISLWNQNQFRQNLILHLNGLFSRSKVRLFQRLPELREIFRYHLVIVDVVNAAVKVLEEENGFLLSENEFGILVEYFCMALYGIEYRHKTTLFIAVPGGKAEALFYLGHISHAFDNLLEHIEACSFEEVYQKKFQGDEILVSPMYLEKVPDYVRQVIVAQNPYENIMRIYRALMEIPQGAFNIDEIISEKWFLSHQNCQSLEQYYEELFNHLCATQTLDFGEARKLYESVEMYGQEIGYHTAVIRGCNPYVNPFLHFTLLSRPMLWRQEMVSMIIFINVSDGSYEYRCNIYKYLNRLLWNYENINLLLMRPDFHLLYKILHESGCNKKSRSDSWKDIPVFPV